jgi:hypothetical protein
LESTEPSTRNVGALMTPLKTDNRRRQVRCRKTLTIFIGASVVTY